MRILLYILILCNVCIAQTLTTNAIFHANYVQVDSVSYHVIPARCGAYITSPVATTITNSGQYYFMQGTFANNLVASFGVVSDTLIYSNGNNRILSIDYHFSMTSSENTTTGVVGVYLNNVLMSGSDCSELMKTAGEEYHFSAGFLVKVNNGDKIKIMVKSDKASSTITATRGSIKAFQIP